MNTTRETVLGYQDISVTPILEGRDSAQCLLRSHGVSNVGRLVNMFDDSQELHDFFTKHAEEAISLEQCTTIWDACNSLYHQVLCRRAKDFKGSLSCNMPVQCTKNKSFARPKDNTAQDLVKRPRLDTPNNKPLLPKEELSRTQHLHSGLWQLLLNMKAVSGWREVLDFKNANLERTKSLWLKRLESTSADSLSAALSAMKRWQKWCEANGASWLNPECQDMAEYLDEVSKGGPTASLSQFRALKWVSANLKAKYSASPTQQLRTVEPTTASSALPNY